MMGNTKWLIGIPLLAINGYVALLVNYPKTALISWFILIPMFLYFHFDEKKIENNILDHALQFLAKGRIIVASDIANILAGNKDTDEIFKILQAHKRNTKIPYDAEIKY